MSGGDDAADLRAARKLFHSLAAACRILDEIELELQALRKDED